MVAGILTGYITVFLVPVLAWKTRQGNTHKPDAKAAGIKKWNLRFAWPEFQSAPEKAAAGTSL